MNINYDKLKSIVEILIDKNKTLSSMESCSGGSIANAITSIEGASKVLNFSAVTYSNEYKIKMGVSEDIINKHSVYSMETAKEMSFKISQYTNSSYGIGITGKLNKSDESNPFGSDNIVFISIYDKEQDKYMTSSLDAIYTNRELNKKYITNVVIELLANMI